MALPSAIFLAVLGAGIAVTYVLSKSVSRSGRRAPLPPGPKGLPLLGNVNDLPPGGTYEAHHWLKHKDLYGPISSVTVLGQTLVILNDKEVVAEILDRRSVKTSSRPRQEFAGEMVGWSRSLGVCPSGKLQRALRKHTSRLLGSKVAVAQFDAMQEEEAVHFVMNLVQDPGRLVPHIRKMAGALILRISYGYTAEPHKDDYLVDIAGDAVDKFTQSAVPGAYLVDMLPWLKHVPGFIPGTAFQQRARQWAHELEQVTEQPYAFVKHQMAQGVNEPSFLSKLIEAGDAPGDQAFSNKWAAQSLYSAGSDTSVAALECFFLAMMVFPEVQRRAQEEIDRVIGKDRLPMLADREKLPYIEGVMKETLRWNPVAPMCLPHTSIEDDVYNGYLIPKSSMLFPNIWHFTHDPESYPDPDEFKPQRYLGAAPAPDPAQYVFGFGRRVCPARLLAQNSVFLMVAQTLAAFDVAKPVEDGKVVEPSVEFLSGVVSHPAPFKASITPRSAHHGRLVESLERAYPWRQGDGHVLESIRTRA